MPPICIDRIVPLDARDRCGDSELSGRSGLQHRRLQPVRRSRYRQVLHARLLHLRGRGGPGDADRRLQAGRQEIRDGGRDLRCPQAHEGAFDGVALRPLPQRPALPLEDRRAADRHRRRRLQPFRLPEGGRQPRHSLPPHQGDEGQQAAGRSAAAWSLSSRPAPS